MSQKAARSEILNQDLSLQFGKMSLYRGCKIYYYYKYTFSGILTPRILDIYDILYIHNQFLSKNHWKATTNVKVRTWLAGSGTYRYKKPLHFLFNVAFLMETYWLNQTFWGIFVMKGPKCLGTNCLRKHYHLQLRRKEFKDMQLGLTRRVRFIAPQQCPERNNKKVNMEYTIHTPMGANRISRA